MSHESVDVLLILVAGRALALPVSAVREVLAAVSLSPPATGDDRCEGHLNLRGRGVPVVNLAGPLGFEASPLTPTQRLVVLEVDGRILAVRSEGPAVLCTATPLPGDEGGAVATSPLLGPAVRIDERIVATLDPLAIRDRLGERPSAVAEGASDVRGGPSG